MSSTLTRIKGNRPVRWSTILGIVLVPLTVAGVLLWGLWNPTERLDTVTAAIVNNDEAVELDGQLVPLGRVVAGELIGSAANTDASDDDAPKNFTWVLTDEEDAEAGLSDGRYATVVTIPEDFSAAATSLTGEPGEARQARIDITDGENGRLIDTALSSIVTQTATGVINKQLGEQFVDGVYVGFNELGDGIGEAADGATELANGTKELSTGTSELATGTRELADGTTQLADGANQLASGTSQLSSGTSQLATGASELSAGTATLADGLGQYVAGATTLSDSYAQLNAGATAAIQQLQAIIGTLGGLEASLVGPQEQLENGLGAVGEGASELGRMIPECYAISGDPAFCDRLAVQAGNIGAGASTAATGATDLGTVLAGIAGAASGGAATGGDPNAQLTQLTDGLAAFGAGLGEYAVQGQQLAAGAAQLSSGAAQLSTGTSELAANIPTLANGASQLATGTTELASGTSELADGTEELATGTTKLADGAGTLATGLGEAAGGIPSTTDAERAKISSAAVAPVTTEGGSDELFNSSGVPLFTGIALWAGALAAFLVLSPLWRRTRDAAQGVAAITLRSALPALALGAVQGAIAGIVLPISLGYSVTQGLGFFGIALVAGVSFALLVQGLSALLHGLGRFIAFALLVVAFAVGIVSTVPAALAAVGDASPTGAALRGFQAIATETAGAGGAVTALVLWGLLGLVLTAFAVVRERSSSTASVRTAAAAA